MVNSHGKYKFPEYRVWWGMVCRCEQETHRSFEDYGGRGISVSPAWRASFGKFIEDVGRRPTKGHTLDRIDVNGNYEPGNVRWATRSEQALNRRQNLLVSFEGERLPLKAAWEKSKTQLSYGVVRQRIVEGQFSFEEAISMSLRVNQFSKIKPMDPDNIRSIGQVLAEHMGEIVGGAS